MSAAANGEMRPNKRMLMEMANETCERLHPKAISRGMMRTDGADRKPAATTSVRNVTAAAIHAG